MFPCTDTYISSAAECSINVCITVCGVAQCVLYIEKYGLEKTFFLLKVDNNFHIISPFYTSYNTRSLSHTYKYTLWSRHVLHNAQAKANCHGSSVSVCVLSRKWSVIPCVCECARWACQHHNGPFASLNMAIRASDIASRLGQSL